MNNNYNEIAKAAEDYLAKGFSVIPIGKNKTPLIEWKKYQNERVNEEQLKKWFEDFTDANVGIVTGSISGIVVVDVETGGDTTKLPPTVIAKTGGGGWHYYYKHPGGIEIKNAVRFFDKTDIRGDGGYVVAPPSLHSSGKNYEWAVSPDEADFAELPSWILEKIVDPAYKKTDWINFSNKTVPEGSRNMTAAQFAGKLLHDLSPELWEPSGWAAFKDWNNKQNKPPLSETEIRNVWESIKKREEVNEDEDETPGRKSQSALLLETLENIDGLEFFHDELNDPFVRLPIGNHKENWRCRSKQFKRWITKIFWDKHNKAINSDALNTALNVIEGKACFDGQKYELANRVAFFDNAIWYDLADSEWRVVKITPGAWEIISDPPILFKRYGHHQAQITPVADGDMRQFLRFVNVADEKNKLLLLVYLVACFIPDFAHPVINIYGSQGSAKSTLSKLLRKLIDPSIIEVSEFSRVPAELIQKFSHHWFVCFDNVSQIQEWVSDLVCKAVTGAGFSKRELYSDDEDVIYTFKRCIGINGINLVAAKPDLLERSILLELERINEKDRKQEKIILAEFERNKPSIMGGIFNAVSKAMEIYPTIKLSTLPRMADFATWGCAIAEAIGYARDEFLNAYDQNIKQQNSEVLMDSFEASAIIEFMADQTEWQGTPSELLAELKKVAAESLGVDTDKEKSFPKAASVLSRRMNQLRPNLETVGIKIQRGEENKKRIIHIQKVDENAVSAVISSDNTEASRKQECDTSDESRQQVFPLPSPETSPISAEINGGYDRDDGYRDILERSA